MTTKIEEFITIAEWRRRQHKEMQVFQWNKFMQGIQDTTDRIIREMYENKQD